MTPFFESVIGFDPDGIRRIYASTWIEARQEARNYIKNRPETAPLTAWRFESWRALDRNDDDAPYRRGLGANAYVTRMHLRYDAASFPEDLALMETPDRSNFHGRYVLHHRWPCAAACAVGDEPELA